jgi:hypothetical protein
VNVEFARYPSCRLADSAVTHLVACASCNSEKDLFVAAACIPGSFY